MTPITDYSDFMIGTSTSTWTSVIELQYGGSDAECPPPVYQYREAKEFSKVANGNLRSLGTPVVVWTLINVPRLGIRALKSLIDTSAELYIQTPDEENELVTLLCVAQWPERPLKWISFGYAEQLEIVFDRCEEV